MSGSDTAGDGSWESPLSTPQRCVSLAGQGTTCALRSGVYRGTVEVPSSAAGVSFVAEEGEEVVFDGTVLLDAEWSVHGGDVWVAEGVGTSVAQLFVGYDLQMTAARWPGTGRHTDGSTWARGAWADGTISKGNENAYANGELVDSGALEASGINATGGVATLNVGSFKTWSRVVRSHEGSLITYDAVPHQSWRTKHHKYFLEGKLEFLDGEEEFFYDAEAKKLYFWPPRGADPNTLELRAKVTDYALDVYANDVTLSGFSFFGATFRFISVGGGTVTDCDLIFPSASKRPLGVAGEESLPVSTFSGSSQNCSVSRCSFRHTDGAALEMLGSKGGQESYFFDVDWSASDGTGLMTTIMMRGPGNVFRRNTIHRTGASSAVSPGNAAIVELNDISDTGHMQTDGALVHLMMPQQPGSEVRYNWLHDTVKYGARFDGTGGGHKGAMHHNVIWNCGRGLMIKGHEHYIYHNTAFDNENGVQAGNDVLVMLTDGGNVGTTTRNNAAGRISGHRTASSADYPPPEPYSHNWNGYDEGGADVRAQLEDPEGRDFRPKVGSALVDAGVADGSAFVTFPYVGAAPDQGAYELGEKAWVPGVTWDVAARNGTLSLAKSLAANVSLHTL